MATRRPAVPPPPPQRLELAVSRGQGEERLRDQITKATQLRAREVQTQEQLDALEIDCKKWQDFTEHLLITIFTTEQLKREFTGAGLPSMVITSRYGPNDQLRDLYKKIDGKRTVLESIVDRLELIPIAAGAAHASAAVENSATVPRTEIEHGYAFIVMAMKPDDHQLDDVLDAIKEAARRCGVTAERIDDQQSNDRITDRVLDAIRRAEFVIADLSSERPNVFYEAGYAHGVPLYFRTAA
jgi:hypothetical protein